MMFKKPLGGRSLEKFSTKTLLTNDATENVREFTISRQDYLRRKNGNDIRKYVADGRNVGHWVLEVSLDGRNRTIS